MTHSLLFWHFPTRWQAVWICMNHHILPPLFLFVLVDVHSRLCCYGVLSVILSWWFVGRWVESKQCSRRSKWSSIQYRALRLKASTVDVRSNDDFRPVVSIPSASAAAKDILRWKRCFLETPCSVITRWKRTQASCRSYHFWPGVGLSSKLLSPGMRSSW